jgi:hypothetical protein
MDVVAGAVSVQRFVRHHQHYRGNDGRDNLVALDPVVAHDDGADCNDGARDDDCSASPADDDGDATSPANDGAGRHGAVTRSTGLSSWWAAVWWSAGVWS